MLFKVGWISFPVFFGGRLGSTPLREFILSSPGVRVFFPLVTFCRANFFCYFFVVAFLWYRETAVRSQSSLVTKARYVIFFAFFSPNLRKKNGMMNGIIEGGGGGGGLAMFVFSVVFCRCSVSGPYFGGPLALPPTPYSTFDCRLTCHRKKTTDKDQSRVPTYTTLPSFTPPPILPHLTRLKYSIVSEILDEEIK